MDRQTLMERLADLIVLQADIIRTQAEALAQFGAVEGLDERIERVEAERRSIIGD